MSHRNEPSCPGKTQPTRDRMISSAAIVSTITQVLSSSMLANEANSLNLWPKEHSQRRTLRVSLVSPSGDWGKTAAAAEGPWSYPCDPAPGALTNAVLEPRNC